MAREPANKPTYLRGFGTITAFGSLIAAASLGAAAFMSCIAADPPAALSHPISSTNSIDEESSPATHSTPDPPLLSESTEPSTGDELTDIAPHATVTDCKSGHTVSMPIELFINCGPRTLRLFDLVWSGWGTKSPGALGQVEYWYGNEKSPTTYPVSITLLTTTEQSDSLVYSHLVVTHRGEYPIGAPKTSRYIVKNP